MVKLQRITTVILAAAFVMCFVAGPVLAQDDTTASEKRSFKEDTKALGRGTATAVSATVNYPANLVNDSVNAVGTAAKNTAGVVIDTGKATGKTLTGDVKQAPKIVTTPVTGTVTTVGTAAKDTLEAPINAGRQTKDQYKKRQGQQTKVQDKQSQGTRTQTKRSKNRK